MLANINPNWDNSEEQRWNLRIALSLSDRIKYCLVSAHTIHTESIVVREQLVVFMPWCIVKLMATINDNLAKQCLEFQLVHSCCSDGSQEHFVLSGL